MDWLPSSLADVSTPPVNIPAVIRYPGVIDKRHQISGIAATYSRPPQTGRLLIRDGDIIIFDLDIISQEITINVLKIGSINTDMFIILAAAGVSNAFGKLNVLGHNLVS